MRCERCDRCVGGRLGPRTLGLVLLGIAAAALWTPAAAQRRAALPIAVTWLGHAGFEIVSPGGTRLLVDPWIEGNPRAPDAWRDAARYVDSVTRPAAILVTHAHGDHDGDAARLARLSGAKVVAVGDEIEALHLVEGAYLSINIGGMQRVGDVEIWAVPATHSVSPGDAIGFVLRFPEGRTLYHTGDTWASTDMAVIEARFHPSIVLVAAGGGRAGMDPDTALWAVRRWFRPQVIVPMHWGTLPPPFAQEADVRAAFATEGRTRILVPGRQVRF